jgi:hypothetical protein
MDISDNRNSVSREIIIVPDAAGSAEKTLVRLMEFGCWREEEEEEERRGWWLVWTRKRKSVWRAPWRRVGREGGGGRDFAGGGAGLGGRRLHLGLGEWLG